MATQNKSSGEDVTVEDLKADLNQLRADMAKLTEDLRGAAKTKVHEAEAAATRRAKAARDEAVHQYEAGNVWLRAQMDERPLAVLGVAFAVGVLLGRGMRR